MLFRRPLNFFKIIFFINSFSNTIRMSSSFNPNQARRIVEPDVGTICLQRSVADVTGRQRVNN